MSISSAGLTKGLFISGNSAVDTLDSHNMAEDITVAFQRFDLTEVDKEGIDLSLEDIEKGIDDCRLSLLGKIMGEKVANFT